MKNLYDVLQGPRLTEKASSLQEEDGKVIFKVNPRANKIDIKRAVEKMFPVKVKTSELQECMGSKRGLENSSVLPMTGRRRMCPF
jgi:large subunit ribosomal protein L23